MCRRRKRLIWGHAATTVFMGMVPTILVLRILDKVWPLCLVFFLVSLSIGWQAGKQALEMFSVADPDGSSGPFGRCGPHSPTSGAAVRHIPTEEGQV